MGLIANLLGLGPAARDVGSAVENVAEVFTVNKTKAELAARAQSMAALGQFGAEFAQPRTGWFDRFINGLNRLPRPIMSLGTVGLFVFAMVDPVAFSGRMQGLAYVPEPLWWLLGAIVSFYFGARELHYARAGAGVRTGPVLPLKTQPGGEIKGEIGADDNPALQEWRRAQGAAK